MIVLIIIIVILLIFRYLLYWKGMNLDNLYNENTIYFGHRGDRNTTPENTITSYSSAIKRGLKAIELDVMVTKDNRLICSHNIDLERETTGKGFIDELTYEELSIFKAGKSYPVDEQDKIPSLIEATEALPEDVLINIEIKTKSAFDLIATKQVAELIKKGKIKQKVIISSFNPVVVRYFKFLVKGIPTGFIYEYANYFYGVFIARPDCLNPDVEFIDKKLIKFCEKRGMRINTWTVNNPYARDWLLERKIAGIITDNPNIAV